MPIKHSSTAGPNAKICGLTIDHGSTDAGLTNYSSANINDTLGAGAVIA